MPDFSNEDLVQVARFFRDNNPNSPQRATAEFIVFGIATSVLHTLLGRDVTNQIVFAQHPDANRRQRDARRFTRAESRGEDEFRNMQRVTRLAELIVNLQHTDGIDGRIQRILGGELESTFSELEAGEFLLARSIEFRFVDASGLSSGGNFDAEIYAGDDTMACEMKCKAERTEISEGAIRNPPQKARTQLPVGAGIIFLKIPEEWVRQPRIAQVMPHTLDAFLRSTSRVAAVVLCWEIQELLPAHGGALTICQYRVERGSPPKTVSPEIEAVLDRIAGPRVVPLSCFFNIAEQVLAD